MISLADDDGVGYSVAVSDDVLNALRSGATPSGNNKDSASLANKAGMSDNAQAQKDESKSSENGAGSDSNAAEAATSTKTGVHKAVSARGLTVNSVPNRAKKKTEPKQLVISPREVQHFIRMGNTVEELHQTYNVAIEYIQRYARPVEREKRAVINLFQNLPARPSRRGRTLLNIASEYFDEQRIDRYTASWSATKSGKQPWLITLKFIRDNTEQIAQWYWDQKNSIISENDDNAKQITKYYEDATEHGSVNLAMMKPVHTDTDWGSSGGSGSLRNITSSLRLRELDRIKGELDNNFKELEVTTSAAKRNLQSSSERAAALVAEPIIKAVSNSEEMPAEAPAKIENTEKTTKQVEEESVNQQKEAENQAQPNAGQKVAEENEELLAPEDISSEQFTEAMAPETEVLDTATTVDELNITGQLRAGLKRKSKQRSSVPSWDNVMLPKSNFQKRFDEEGDE